jgi:sterol desaturase/sphingolipid hydroxylase (fatty acid hydroxylase superfamily)
MLHTYWFWLIIVSLGFVLLERLRPWRQQRLLRPQFGQDLVWLALNGHVAGLALGFVFAAGATAALKAAAAIGAPDPQTLQLIAHWPLWLQGITALIAKDFLEFGVHNLLHRIPILWRFHQVHHSIQHMDWIGNFRFHWMEIIIYKSLTWLPLILLGTNEFVLFILAIIVTAIGHHNHSNLNVGWGPFKYVLNSPRFHLWHHDRVLRRANDGAPAHGCNFAIVFTCWDWIFGTAYYPKDGSTPERLGFPKDEQFPTSLVGRMFAPFIPWGNKSNDAVSK